MKIYRQGDILLRERATKPIGIKHRARKSYVVAIGEGEGHAHTLTAPRIRVFSDGLGHPSALEVEGGVGVLDHPEHASVAVAPGTYDVVREQEANLEGHAYDTVD
jgi:hypothetical protein